MPSRCEPDNCRDVLRQYYQTTRCVSIAESIRLLDSPAFISSAHLLAAMEYACISNVWCGINAFELNVATNMSTLSATETEIFRRQWTRTAGAWVMALMTKEELCPDDVLLTYSLTHYTDNIRNIPWHTSYSQIFVSTSVECTRVAGRMLVIWVADKHMLVCVVAYWDFIDWQHECLTKTEFALVYCFPTIMGRGKLLSSCPDSYILNWMNRIIALNRAQCPPGLIRFDRTIMWAGQCSVKWKKSNTRALINMSSEPKDPLGLNHMLRYNARPVNCPFDGHWTSAFLVMQQSVDVMHAWSCMH